MLHRQFRWVSLVAFPLVWLSAPALALTSTAGDHAAPLTRAEVSRDRDAFARSHPPSEVENWLLEPDAPRTGMNTRADVKAERDASRRLPRWDAAALAWLNPADARSVEAPPTREEVRSEARAFVLMRPRDGSASDVMSDDSVGGP